MAWFHRKMKALPFDPSKLQPAVRKSYCNREMTLGFLDKQTGRFIEHCGATSQRQVEEFCRSFGVKPEDLKTIY